MRKAILAYAVLIAFCLCLCFIRQSAAGEGAVELSDSLAQYVFWFLVS
jgi:hypothetical protein